MCMICAWILILLFMNSKDIQGRWFETAFIGVEAWFSIGHERIHAERLATFSAQKS